MSQFTAVYGDLGCEHCLISFIRSMGDNEVLSLFNLTLKFVMLLALLNGQRTQTLSFFNLDNMHVYEDSILCSEPCKTIKTILSFETSNCSSMRAVIVIRCYALCHV